MGGLDVNGNELSGINSLCRHAFAHMLLHPAYFEFWELWVNLYERPWGLRIPGTYCSSRSKESVFSPQPFFVFIICRKVQRSEDSCNAASFLCAAVFWISFGYWYRSCSWPSSSVIVYMGNYANKEEDNANWPPFPATRTLNILWEEWEHRWLMTWEMTSPCTG